MKQPLRFVRRAALSVFLYCSPFIFVENLAFAREIDESILRQAKRIGIMVGTFDPVHNVHLELAQRAAQQGGLDFVLVVPNPAPVTKDPVPTHQRLEMIRLATQSLDDVGVVATNSSLRQTFLSTKSLTALMTEIRSTNPDIEILGVVGHDLANNPPTMRRLGNKIRPERWLVGLPENSSSNSTNRTDFEYVRLQSRLSSRAIQGRLRQHMNSGHSPISPALAQELGLSERVSQHITAHGLYLEEVQSAGSRSKQIQAAAMRRLVQIAERSGIFEAIRDSKIERFKEDQVTHLNMNGQNVAVRRFLGAGLRGNAYIVEMNGQEFVLKYANQREGSQRVLANSVRTHNYLLKEQNLRVPQLYAYNLQEGWSLNEFIQGENLQKHLAEAKTLSPELRRELERLWNHAQDFSRQTGQKLDIRADNIILRDGKAYLIDLGPFTRRQSQPESFASVLKWWKSQSAGQSVFAQGCMSLFNRIGLSQLF